MLGFLFIFACDLHETLIDFRERERSDLSACEELELPVLDKLFEVYIGVFGRKRFSVPPKPLRLLFTRSGLCIRFSLDSVPVQGRVAAGVRCMQVEDGDEVIWCGQLQDSDQIVLLTDRGYAKRLLSVDFEKQNRNGKGVKSFYFNKNGSNGKQLAGVVRLEKDDHLIRVQQAKSPATLVERDNVRLQGKQDRGMPLVIAVMDDVVTAVEPAAESTAETAE